MWIARRWLTLLAIKHSGIRRDCAYLLDGCRLLVVLTEGGDLRSYFQNEEILPEACEIGIQGVRLSLVYCLLVQLRLECDGIL